MQGPPGPSGVLFICGDGGDELCEIGAVGPGGGKVFYVSLNGFRCIVQDERFVTVTFEAICHHLEAAPANVPAGTNEFFWSTSVSGIDSTDIEVGTDTFVGSGQGNTAKANAPDRPAVAAAASYVSPNGTDDWFLPSRDELVLLFANRNRAVIGGLGDDFAYWSSSEHSAGRAWQVDRINMSPSDQGKNAAAGVRPVRAF